MTNLKLQKSIAEDSTLTANKTSLKRPSFALSLTICTVAVIALIFFRTMIFPEYIVPLTFGLPLLLCLWNRDKRLLWGMTVALSAFVVLNAAFLLSGHPYPAGYLWFAAACKLVSIWAVAYVLHLLLRALLALEARTEELFEANAELESSNEELAAREEEITRQNEELQCQTEELEQQHEELSQQSEELESQSEELQNTNQDLSQRQKALQILFDSAGWMTAAPGAPNLMKEVCKAAVEGLGGEVCAAAIVTQEGGMVVVRGHFGFGERGLQELELPFSESLTAVVMDRRQPAYIKDLSLRPDLHFLQPASGELFYSVLSAPLYREGKTIGALEVFSRSKLDWNQDNFKMIEWLASQTSLIRESMERQNELEKRRKEAEESSIRKTRFLAAVSHDVRTPANAISLIADLLSRYCGDPAKLDQIGKLSKDLKKSARRLVELVSHVLEIASYDSGRGMLKTSTFSLKEVIDAEVSPFIPLAEAKGIKIHSSLATINDTFLKTDKVKLIRILSNLISNAIKFTDKGEIVINAEPTFDGRIKIQVIDTGPGIPEQQLNYIFDEFYQIQNKERDWSKGTGLGLSICKRLVDHLGASITVESKAGVGSTFSVYIPKDAILSVDQQSAHPDLAPVVNQQHVPGNDQSFNLKGLRVLLIEDHDLTRTATRELLTAEGGEVLEAPTGKVAMQILKNERPQVILIDLMLPDTDGIEILKEVRSNPPQDLLATFVLSGDITESRRERVKELGADGFLEKPLDSEKLLGTLGKIISYQESAIS